MEPVARWPVAGGRNEPFSRALTLYKDALVAGHVAATRGRLEEALGAYRRAEEIGPHRPLPLVRQGAVLLELGRLDEALAAYSSALVLSPSDRAALSGRRTIIARGAGVELGGGGVQAAWPRLSRAFSTELFLIGYMALLVVAEILVTFVSPVLVFPLDGGLVVLVSLHVAWLARQRVETAESRALIALLLAFVLAPLIRIISLTLPLAQIEAPYRYLFAGVPMTLAALVVARTLGLRRGQIGVTWRAPGLQLMTIVVSLGLGFVEFTILRPPPMGAPPWTLAGFLPAATVFIFTGAPEELIFRGILQTVARPILKSATVLYSATVFAVLHIGYKSLTDLLFVFAVGLFYGWMFERSRSIVGTSIGHGLANVVLFFVAPALFPGLIGHPIL